MSGPCQDDRATVALAFANTSVEGYSDDGAGADALEAWLVGQRLVGADVEVTHTELARFLRLRIAIRAVLDARIDRRAPEDSAVRIVESAALAAPGTTIGVWAADGSVSRGWRSTGGDPLDRAAATLAADLVDLVCDHGERLGRDGDGGTGFVMAAAG
jgi:hypothetical protein